MTTVLLNGEDKVTIVTEQGNLVFTQISDQRIVLAVGPEGPFPPVEQLPLPGMPEVQTDPRVRPSPFPTDPPVRPGPGNTVPPVPRPKPTPPGPIGTVPPPVATGENWLLNGNLMGENENPSFEHWFSKEGYFYDTSIQPDSGGMHRPITDWAAVAPVAYGLQCDWDWVSGTPSRRNTWPQPENPGELVLDEAWTEVENPPPHSESLTFGFAVGHHIDKVPGSQYEGVAIVRLEGMMDDDDEATVLFEQNGFDSPIGTGHPNPATVGPDLPEVVLVTVPLGEHGPWDIYRVLVVGGMKGKNAGFVVAGFTLTGK